MVSNGNIQRFVVSAPGKVIVHGEHSVVHGQPAIAGPIALRTVLVYTALERSAGSPEPEIVLEFRSIPCTTTLSLESFNAFLRDIDCCTSLQPADFLLQMRAPGEFPFARYLREPARFASGGNLKERMSLGASMYIINRVLRSEGVRSIDATRIGDGGLQFSMASAMSIGAGLGSSASYGVCLSAGAYVLSRILKRELDEESSSLEGVLVGGVLDKISSWAYDSEIIMHEKPSGIDNTIATYGQLIHFRRGEPHRPIALRHPLHVLIVDTGVSRSTAHLVATAASRRTLFPRTIGTIYETMGALADEATALLESDDEPGTVFERLSTLVSINNNLLRSLGASHPSLEQIFTLAERHGFASKLTGAGGGGCAFALLPPHYQEMDSFRQLVKALEHAGFSTIETTVGVGSGVTLSTGPDGQPEGGDS